MALQARRDQGTHPDSQSHSLAGSRRCAGRGGARRGPGGAERRQAALRHSARGPVPLVATGSLPRRRGATARVPYGGAAAASYAPGGQPARHTCHHDPARPAWSASTPRGPPRYSAGCRGYPALGSARRAACGRRTATRQPAMIKPSRFAKKKRASDMEKLQTHPVAIGAATSCLTLPADGMARRSSTEQRRSAQCVTQGLVATRKQKAFS